MTPGLESLGHHGVHTRFAALEREFRTRHHVRHAAACVVQTCGPGRGVARRGEDGRDALFRDDVHQLGRITVGQRHVDAERPGGGRTAFADVLAQQFGGHRAGADQPQPAGLADGGGQPPAAAPDHPACDDGVADAEKGRDSVFHRFLVFCGIKIQLFFQNGSGCSGRYAQKKAALRPVGSKRRYEKKGELLTSHRYDHIPLLDSSPGGFCRSWSCKTHPGTKVGKFYIFAKKN